MTSFSGRLFRATAPHIPVPIARAFSAPAAVFFHGVEADPLDAHIAHNHHAKDEFAKIARALRANFDVLPLGAIGDVLRRPERHPRALFLMSDDGYANTLGVAADILDDMKLPWTLFVSTDHVDRGTPNPMLVFRLFFAEAAQGVYRIPHIHPSVVLAGFVQRAAEETRVLRQILGLDARRARVAIAVMAKAIGDVIARYPAERFLLWDEVRALSRRGVEIGAHAHWHWPMNDAQSQKTLRAQAGWSKARIEREVGPCRFFAYPFGQPADVSAKAWRAVREAGFSHAFTTVSGTLDASGNRWLLPRYGLPIRPRNVASLVATLRAGNPRLRRWQEEMAA